MRLAALVLGILISCGGIEAWAEQAPTTGPATRPALDYASLVGVWIHQRTDAPGPQEPTYYILQLSGNGDWAWAGLWGTPEKPLKALIYGRGTKARLLPVGDSWGPRNRDAFFPKPKSLLMLPLSDHSFLSLGALARKGVDAIIFHNFESIYWTNEYRRASPQLEQSLRALLQRAPAATQPG